ncbi:MAG: DUF166 domain-containing protein [Promethearchaeota archaeon]
MRIYILYQDEFAERVAGHLVNDVHFCIACGTGCNNCRLTYGRYAGNIEGYEEIEGNFPEIIDEPADYLPEILPEVDVLIPIGLHPDLLSGLPIVAKRSGIKAIVVPIEDKNWVPGGLESQLKEELDELGVQYAFPRPFCALDVPRDDPSKSVIREFMDEFKIGKPEIELEIRNGKIMNGYVKRSQPCGAAYYIIQQLREEPVFDPAMSLDEKISQAHHSFPCSGSMEVDPIIKESPLHFAGYLARDSVHEAIERKIGEIDRSKFHHQDFVETRTTA